MSRWSPARVWTGLAMAAWAALFWFVLVDGRVGLYLSPRTAWLVPMGGVLATAAAAGRLATARTSGKNTMNASGAHPSHRGSLPEDSDCGMLHGVDFDLVEPGVQRRLRDVQVSIHL